MKRARRAGIYTLLVIALVVGFLLPSIVANVQDAQTDQTTEVVSASRVQLEMSSALTVLQKFRIVSERTSSIEMDSAPTMKEEEALDELLVGLEELFSPELEEIPFSAEDFTEVNHTINLKMSGEDSLIYWEFWLADGDGNQITASLDDDTGVILSLNYSLNLGAREVTSRESPILPESPLFLLPESQTESAAGVLFANGIYGGLEETGSTMEELLELLQEQYCGDYLRNKGYHFNWETETSEPLNSSYLYTVMVVDNAGGYYVLPFTLSNNEISIN